MTEIADLVQRIELADDVLGALRALRIATEALGELALEGDERARAAIVAMAHTLEPTR